MLVSRSHSTLVNNVMQHFLLFQFASHWRFFHFNSPLNSRQHIFNLYTPLLKFSWNFGPFTTLWLWYFEWQSLHARCDEYCVNDVETRNSNLHVCSIAIKNIILAWGETIMRFIFSYVWIIHDDDVSSLDITGNRCSTKLSKKSMNQCWYWRRRACMIGDNVST